MGADENVDFSFSESFQYILLFSWASEPAEHFDSEIEPLRAFQERFVMLVGQNGYGRNKGDLFATLHCFESRAHGDFRFSETYVSADQAVHRAVGFHVVFHVMNGLHLAGCFLVGECLFESVLFIGIGP